MDDRNVKQVPFEVGYCWEGRRQKERVRGWE
jgi:hypothetical protein